MLVFMVSIVVNNTWVNCLGWFFVWEIRRAVGWSRGRWALRLWKLSSANFFVSIAPLSSKNPIAISVAIKRGDFSL